ncbi:MAG: hypothetical protein HYX27_05630 [Acidobacteria bacterium]|nr:hypothetical protein [Acidobacteriota bacterium]
MIARESWFWLHCLIMLFAEAVCKPANEHETPLTFDAGQRSVSGMPRFVRMQGKSERKRKMTAHPNPR